MNYFYMYATLSWHLPVRDICGVRKNSAGRSNIEFKLQQEDRSRYAIPKVCGDFHCLNTAIITTVRTLRENYPCISKAGHNALGPKICRPNCRWTSKDWSGWNKCYAGPQIRSVNVHCSPRWIKWVSPWRGKVTLATTFRRMDKWSTYS